MASSSSTGCSSPPPSKRARWPDPDPKCDLESGSQSIRSCLTRPSISEDDTGSSWYLPTSEMVKHRSDSGNDAEGGDSGFSDGGATAASCDDSQEGFPTADETSMSQNQDSFSHNNSDSGMDNKPTSFASSELFSFTHQSHNDSLNHSSSTSAHHHGQEEHASLPPDLADVDLHMEDGELAPPPSHIPHNHNAHQDSHHASMPDISLPSGAENEANREGDDDDDDAVSSISGISDLSGSDWKPTAGPFSWVQQQMMKGADPRALLKNMISADSVIPDHLDQLTLWKIILNMVSEPPRRKKLDHINTLTDVVDLIKTSRKIIVLTGAGVSVSCGIPDFRSRDGVYARLAVDFPDLPDPQAMFDIHYFRKDPRPFFKFAKEIYPGQFRPSPCHKFIRCLEKNKKLLRNYTQNIDTLEQVVGIQQVVQCHGSFATATCTQCRFKMVAEEIKEDIFAQRIPYCPKCIDGSTTSSSDGKKLPTSGSTSSSTTVQSSSGASSNLETALTPPSTAGTSSPSPPSSSVPEAKPARGIMKPDIVFFGEGLGDEFHRSVALDKHEVDLLIMIGSSLKVRPVALIPSSISPEVPQILINRESLSHLTPDVELLGDCDGIINQLCQQLGDGWEDAIHKDPLKETLHLEPPVTEREMASSVDASNSSLSDSKSNTGASNSSGGDGEVKTQEAESKEMDDEQKILSLYWKPRQSLAHRLPVGHYQYCPPSKYIFPGAEVYETDQDSDDSDDLSDDDDDGNVSDDENSSGDNTSTSQRVSTSDVSDALPHTSEQGSSTPQQNSATTNTALSNA